MKGFSPEKLENIITTLSTLYRAGAMEASGESTIAGRNIITAAYIMGGSNLLLEKALVRIADDLRDFMQSNDGRLNQLHNALLGLVQCIEQGVRLSDSNAEALLMRLNGFAEQLGDAGPELTGAIESMGNDIGAGLAEGLQVACKGRTCRRGT